MIVQCRICSYMQIDEINFDLKNLTDEERQKIARETVIQTDNIPYIPLSCSKIPICRHLLEECPHFIKCPINYRNLLYFCLQQMYDTLLRGK